jgi:hypothetical protein
MNQEMKDLIAKFGKGKPTKIVPEPSHTFSAAVYDTFARPALAMVCWGAFVHIAGLPLDWCLGYWAFFMLNFVAVLFTNTPVTRWVIKK